MGHDRFLDNKLDARASGGDIKLGMMYKGDRMVAQGEIRCSMISVGEDLGKE
jgi:uncharacterized lipoprotein YehR (DUF1307 family)